MFLHESLLPFGLSVSVEQGGSPAQERSREQPDGMFQNPTEKHRSGSRIVRGERSGRIRGIIESTTTTLWQEPGKFRQRSRDLAPVYLSPAIITRECATFRLFSRPAF
jgi:hypothetical protein